LVEEQGIEEVPVNIDGEAKWFCKRKEVKPN
jgi:hypothetical protein